MKKILLLALSAFSVSVSAADVKIGGWYLEKSIDSFTDKPSYSAQFLHEKNGGMAVFCINQKISIVVMPGNYIGKRAMVVRWRFDKNEVRHDIWDAATSGQAVFAPVRSSVELAQKLAKSKKFAFEVSDYNSVPQKLIVPLSGSAKPIKAVLQQCGQSLK